MPESLALLARTFVIGLAVAVPVGSMSVLCMERTLAHGWRVGAATGLGIATADALYAAVAAFGLSAVSSALVAWQAPLRLVGGAALVVMGAMAFTRAGGSAGRPVELDDASPRGGERGCVRTEPVAPGRAWASAVALTLTNPMTIMAFGAILASAGLAALGTPAKAAVATAGVGLGSLAWWLALTAVVARVRHRVSVKTSAWLTRASSLVLAAFGVVAVLSALVP